MPRKSTIRSVPMLLAVGFSLSLLVSVPLRAANPQAGKTQHVTTRWEIKPSRAFDVLCLLNTLTADSFYLEYYADEYARFAPQLTPHAVAALADLKHRIKDSAQGIISASLCLYFSATHDSTLDDLINTVHQSSGMQDNLKLTPYYSDDDWKLFESVRPDLDTIFQFLKQIKFEEYWRRSVLPKVNSKITSIDSVISKYNVIPEVEGLLGEPLSSDQITVYMLYYSQPHGIKIVGTRFLTDVAWPFTIVVRNATHEMMHPPYRLASDTALAAALNLLKQDDFLMDKVQHHDPSFGYNSFEGFIEEDCVQALDQVINEKLGLGAEPHHRWQMSDDGMHVFAIALYQVMKSEAFNEQGETFAEFLIRMIRNGRLAPGTIKPLYEAFYPPGAEHK